MRSLDAAEHDVKSDDVDNLSTDVPMIYNREISSVPTCGDLGCLCSD